MNKDPLSILRITDLHLRAIIGIHEWEREVRQDIVINAELGYDASHALASDSIEKALDYRALTKDIIRCVENSQFFLMEKLADAVLELVMAHPLVVRALVRVDKPGALRYARSVSVQVSASQDVPS